LAGKYNALAQGLILGRKAFQRPFEKGVEMLQMIQDVYPDKNITTA
jgi:class I fructose-bisphosphate aldolase